MPVPNTFANATTTIPLSDLDNNFATAITIGNTAVQLGNTVTTLNNMTFANVTISSVASTFPNSYFANNAVTIGNTSVSLGSTQTTFGNVTLNNATIASGNVTITDATIANSVVISGNTAGNLVRITQTGAGNAILVEDSTNPDSTPVVIDTDGNLVAGQLTPIQAKNFFSGALQSTKLSAGGDASASGHGALGIFSTATTSPILSFVKGRGNFASKTSVASGDWLGKVSFQGYDGSNLIEAAFIDAQVDGTPGTNDMPGRLTFSTTADGASSPTERMRINSAGQIGFNSTALGGVSGQYRFAGNMTGVTSSSSGIVYTPTVQSDVTATAIIYNSQPSTQAAAFTLTNLTHFSTNQGTIGATSVVTNQYGFQATSSLTGATNNYGFYSDIAAPTSGITTTGTITSISSSGTTVTVNHNAITYTNGQTVTVTATANATALTSGATCTILTVGTTDFTLIGAASNTVGTSFTATGAGTGTGTVTLNVQGSGKTVAGAASGSFTFTTTTSQTFSAVTVLSGSVTVSTRWNFYANGTAPNFFAGNVGIGVDPGVAYGFVNQLNITGNATSVGSYFNGQVQSDVASAYGLRTDLRVAASVALTDLNHYAAGQDTIGAGATITSQHGFIARSNLTGATNNYGFLSNIASGTGRWNFFANGTANNAFNGSSRFGGVTAPTALVAIAAGTNAANTAPLKFTSGTNLDTPEAGVVEYDGTVMTATSNTNFKRGTIPITNYASGTGTTLGTNTEATLQNLLPAANDTITLSAGTYFVDTSFIVTRGASTTSATARLNILGSGGAAGNFSGMSLSAPTAGGATANFSFDAVNINVSNVLTAASATSGGVYTITLRGILKITSGGTIVPQYNLSVNINGAGTVAKVLYFKLQQIDTQSAAAFGPAGTGWG